MPKLHIHNISKANTFRLANLHMVIHNKGVNNKTPNRSSQKKNSLHNNPSFQSLVAPALIVEVYADKATKISMKAIS